uniref:RNA methyltransferase n=1 Tax=Nicotiana tabacum TaxID=4097 RepID=A0A1S3X4R2_TOBAC|nr:PREDICTED: probable RNA methyltransferase At5g51130 [Nicotiana tabacum]XP_016434914.1 PREDICTED: probable RNA methyltransferase At5g51130 [Nicotiana tabacum]XP_016434915.1 PREDICTED: probable RNA methyltransferase At5g51130 [Nicotiana tabacum]XP_016434916.1 PREDICTED: probable RNA methyltransferase At5g51130 [Nicotiana tabacum]XP_016434917.1 PREDICTED: probable RNA methyltransferase At5g51130 [Nicotiana tabacum]
MWQSHLIEGQRMILQHLIIIRYWHPRGNTSYDTIICLSVTKWVQLNWGDEGLITLFSKVWRLLSPGGVFILEPQPWDSYYKKHLVSEIGFRTAEAITCSASGDGFKRPLLAIWK